MTNSDSYRMMEGLRNHLNINVYEVKGSVEIVISFRTVDGKVHQICNSYKEKVVPALLKG